MGLASVAQTVKVSGSGKHVVLLLRALMEVDLFPALMIVLTSLQSYLEKD